jgi:hypothetical protein
MLCLLLVGRKKEREGEKKKGVTAAELYSEGCFAGSATHDFHGC